MRAADRDAAFSSTLQAAARPSISDQRRRQILAQLASERAERRGFASEREIQIAKQHSIDAAASEEASASSAGASSSLLSSHRSAGAPQPRSASDIQTALQSAASAAVSSALEKAFASIGLPVPPTATLTTEAHATTAPLQARDLVATSASYLKPATAAPTSTVQLSGASRAGSAAVAASSRLYTSPPRLSQHGGPSAALSPTSVVRSATGAPEPQNEKDRLIQRLLDERRARLSSEARGGSYDGHAFGSTATGPFTGPAAAALSSGTHVSTSTSAAMPPMPPIVAALQAQAAAAAASAAAAIATATASAHAIGVGTAVRTPNAMLFREQQQRMAQEQQRQHGEALSMEQALAQGRSIGSTATSEPGQQQASASLSTSSGGRTRSHRSVKWQGDDQPSAHDLAESASGGVCVVRSPKTVNSRLLSGRAKHSGASSASAALEETQGQRTQAANDDVVSGAEPTSADGKKFKRPSIEQVKRERENVLYGECTFKPAVVPSAQSSSSLSSSSAAVNRSRDTSGSGAHERLAQSKVTTWAQREKLRKAKEDADMKANCSFQPRVSSASRSRSPMTSQQSLPVPEQRQVQQPPQQQQQPVPQQLLQRSQSLRNTKIPEPYQPAAPAQVQRPPVAASPPPRAPVQQQQQQPPASPAKPGSPLHWEGSLAKRYLEAHGSKIPRAQQQQQQTTASAVGTRVLPEAPRPAASVAAPAQQQAEPRWEPVAQQQRRGPAVAAAPAVGGRPTIKPPQMPSQHQQHYAGTFNDSSPTASGSVHDGGGGSSGKVVPPVVARLYSDADKRNLERARAKGAIERAQMAVHSFKPAINPTSIAILAKESAAVVGSGGAQSSSIHPSLHKPIHERSADIQRAQAEHLHRLRMESILANPELTFKPRINETSERIAIAKARQAGLPISDSNAMGADGGPLSPPTDIYPNTAGTDAAPSVSASRAATERLTREAADAQARKEARKRAAAQVEAARFTFQPRVNPNSNRMVQQKLKSMGVDVDKVAGSSKASFEERQRVMLDLQRAHKEAILKEVAAMDECRFKPDIGNADEVLALTRPELVTESDSARVNRLAVDEAASKARNAEAAHEEYYSQFKFKPVINERSRQRGRVRTLDEQVNNTTGQRIKLRAKAIAEAEFLEKHPFQPKLIASDPTEGRARSKDSAGSGGRSPSGAPALAGSVTGGGKQPLRLAVRSDPDHVSERIQGHLKAKAEQVESQKRLMDYEQLRECTFQPDTEKSAKSYEKGKEQVAADGGVVVVRGLGRYLELKELQRRLDDDRR